MKTAHITLTFAIAMAGIALLGCQPEAPPDLVKTQRETLDKAKAVEGQIQQKAQEQRISLEETEK